MRSPTLAELPPVSLERVGWPWSVETAKQPKADLDSSPWPRISIVTPSLNQGRYLEETIRSVLLQGYPDLEFIVMDGGSSDESLQILRRYEPWLAFWRSEPDGGQTQAINSGWDRSTGQILAYINADDSYLPGALTAAATAFRSRSGVAMVYGNARVVDESGRYLRMWLARPFSLRAMLLAGNVVPQPAAFFARDAMERVGWLAERWDMIMDYEVSIRLGVDFSSVCLPTTLATFRDHSNSKSRTQHDLMARELVRFVAGLDRGEIPARDFRVLQNATLARIHYEWAFACLAPQGQGPVEAYRHLRRSLRFDPRFAMRKPLDTAYAFKEIALRRLLYARSR
jgi:glycosyltransferase involved in cell wall biosynthesis